VVDLRYGSADIHIDLAQSFVDFGSFDLEDNYLVVGLAENKLNNFVVPYNLEDFECELFADT
jgi:hypothetical protein